MDFPQITAFSYIWLNRKLMKHALLFAATFFTVSLFAQTSEGPLNPSAGANTSCPFAYSSAVDYMPAANVTASDDQYATASHCDCCDQNTRCLESTSFGFSIPLTATINGIVVEVEKHASANSMVQDNGVRIIKNGSTAGNDHLLATPWPAADAWSTYGSPTDPWGVAWMPADINASNFGVAIASISYTCNGNGGAMISYIDNIRITVYYTDISTGISSVASDGSGMEIFPNPSSGNVTLSVSSADAMAMVKCFDVAGKEIFTVNKMTIGGKIVLEETNELAEGIYFLEVMCGEERRVGKLVVE
jgi:hypothetical protein